MVPYKEEGGDVAKESWPGKIPLPFMLHWLL